jgi:hypothetical protein
MSRLNSQENHQVQPPRDDLRADFTNPQNLRKKGQVGGEDSVNTEAQEDEQPDADALVPLVKDGEGNHQPDAAHEPKASTLSKQEADRILDEEEARFRAKHEK